jgi:5,5'-dehydrodivanillate O-demethylase
VVGRAVDLPVGRATKIKVLGEEFTLYRGETGTPHVVAHRCPHRGTQLSAGYVEGDEIRCIYHGWKFNGDGACTERPGEVAGGEAKAGIKSYPTHEFLGLIYSYFGEAEPPAFPPYPAFEGEGIIETYGGVFHCNYFQSWENDWDVYHANFTHKTGQLHNMDYARVMASEKYEETPYGFIRHMEVQAGAVNEAILLFPATIQLTIPTFNEQKRKSGGQGPLFRPTYLVHVPIDDQSHMVYITQLVGLTGEDADEYLQQYAEVVKIRSEVQSPWDAVQPILNGTAAITDAKDHPMLVEIEDFSAQCGQGPIVDRHHEMLGRTDAGVILLRRIMAREYQAMEEGRPTTAWTKCPLIELVFWETPH